MAYIYTTRIRYHHTDRMGVVYYADYLKLFEEARTDFLRDNGFPYKDIEDNKGIFFPVSEVYVKYAAPLYYDDEVRISVGLADVRRVRFSVTYQVTAGAGTMTTQGYTVHPVIDRKGRPVRLPDDLREFIERQTAETEISGLNLNR